MVMLAQATVLAVGTRGVSQTLRELPIKVTERQSGVKAARSLKNENFDSLICGWHMEDLDPVQFLQRLRVLKPELPVVVLINNGNLQQEIQARSIGAAAVLTELCGEDILKNVIKNILSLKPMPLSAEVIEK